MVRDTVLFFLMAGLLCIGLPLKWVCERLGIKWSRADKKLERDLSDTMTCGWITLGVLAAVVALIILL